MEVRCSFISNSVRLANPLLDLSRHLLGQFSIICADQMNTDGQNGSLEDDSFLSLVSGPAARASDDDTVLETPHRAHTSSNTAPVTPEQGLCEGSQPDLGFADEKGRGFLPLEHDSACLDGPSAPHFPAEDTARSSEIPVSRSDYNRALFEARMGSMQDVELKMPWETGIMKQIFDSDDDSAFPKVLPPVPPDYLMPVSASGAETPDREDISERPTAKSLVRSDASLPFYSFAIRVVPDRDIFMEEALLWEKAIWKWLQIFEILGFPGMLGHALLSEQVDTTSASQSAVLRDALGIKSPRTALKRAQTLLRYFSWLQSNFQDWDPWNRAMCLQYIGQVGARAGPASKGITLLEALRFGRYVMDLPIPEGLLSDPQLRGRAQRLMISKDVYHPARPLRATELATLERAMDAGLDSRDVYILGSVIFAVLSRSRWSDLKHVDQFWIERAEFNGEPFGFVEARTKFHKTATNLAKKQRYMPLVAPLLGVTDTDWSRHWVEAMLELKVDINFEPFGAICRAPAHDGTLCARSCTSEEVSAFINKFLKTGEGNSISSHSFKHTTLAWCSAYGLDEPSRTLLGHHELQGAKSMAVYSRDMLTRPLQLYCSMLANIRKDHFRPDESRTSRMLDLLKISENKVAPQEKQLTGTAQIEMQQAGGAADDDGYAPSTPMDTERKSSNAGDPVDDESSGIASSSSSSDDSSSECVENATSVDIPGPVWRNKRSHVVHKCSEIERQTACGRLVVAANFEMMEKGCSSLNARCSRCFKGEVITNVRGLVEALDQQKAKRQRDR